VLPTLRVEGRRHATTAAGLLHERTGAPRMSNTPTTPGGRSPLPTLFLTAFIDLLGFGLTIPLLPFYAQRYGASATEVSLLFASFSLMGFLFVPVWGELSDRVGRRPVLLTSIAATSASMLLLAFSNSFAMLLLSRVLQGIMTANLSTIQAYIADVTRPEDRARSMGMIGAAFGLGFILGPFFGGTLATYSLRAPGLAAAALAAVNFLLALRNLPESLNVRQAIVHSPVAGYREGPREPDLQEPFGPAVIGRVLLRQATLKPLREAFAQPELGLLIAVFFLQSFAFTNLEATFALYTRALFGFGPRETGFLFGYIGLLVVLVQGGVYGRLSRRFEELKLAQAGMFLVASAMVLLMLLPRAPGLLSLLQGNDPSFARRALPMWFILPLSSMGNALLNPSLSSATSKRGRADRLGGTLGVQQSAGALARVLGPLTAGFAFDRFGPGAPMTVAALGMIVAAFMVAVVPPVKRAEKEEPAGEEPALATERAVAAGEERREFPR
jgi:DHA1 family tetracycline resistance protein-like MFS transporter